MPFSTEGHELLNYESTATRLRIGDVTRLDRSIALLSAQVSLLEPLLMREGGFDRREDEAVLLSSSPESHTMREAGEKRVANMPP